MPSELRFDASAYDAEIARIADELRIADLA
jgi:hypothetical protein